MSTTSPFPRYMPALDGLRGIAVLMVLVHHLALPMAGDASTHPAFFAARFGWAGVDLFFVLSGFLITGILYDHRESRHRMRAFYGRRLLRIAPLYYLTLIGYGALLPVVAAPSVVSAFQEALPWHATYLTNVRLALTGVWAGAPAHTTHLWSLAVEEQFYLIWPLLVGVIVRVSRSPRKTLIWICGGLIVASLVYRVWSPGINHIGRYVLLPARMDALAVGAGIALLARGPNGVAGLIRYSRPVLLGGGVLLVATLVLSAGLYSYADFLQQTAGYSLWALVWGGIIIQAAGMPSSRFATLLSARPLLATGRISYGLYLLHYPILYVLDQVGVRELGALPYAAIGLGASFGLAVLSWRYVESPLLRLKSHFPYDAKREASTQVALEARA